jgi:prepilin peptidase CpaA
MLDDPFKYGLLAALAIALLVAAFTDLEPQDRQLAERRSRWAPRCSGGPAACRCGRKWRRSLASPWPPSPSLAGLFALRAMGGGDVKLLTALALWIAADALVP